MNVSRQTINAIEKEKFDPSLPLAFRIARAVRHARSRRSSSTSDRIGPHACAGTGPSRVPARPVGSADEQDGRSMMLTRSRTGCWSTRASACRATPSSCDGGRGRAARRRRGHADELAGHRRATSATGRRRGRLLDAPALGSRALAPRARRRAPLRHRPVRGRLQASAVEPGLEDEIAEDVAAGDRRARSRWTCSAASRGCPPGSARIPWDGPAVRIIEHRGARPGHAALLIEEQRCPRRRRHALRRPHPVLGPFAATRSRTTSRRSGCSRTWRATPSRRPRPRVRRRRR